MLYVRKQTMATIPKSRCWGRFATKLQQAARLVEWIVPIVKKSGKNSLDCDRRRLHQAAIFEAGFEACEGLWSWDDCAKTPPCATCQPKQKNTSRSRSATQVRQEQNQSGEARRAAGVVGKRSSARSTAKQPSRPTRRSWPPTRRWAA